jgi:hypothetical protein
MRQILILVIATFSLVHCSTPPKTTVIPKENGELVMISNSKDEGKALQAAIDEGNKYCETKGKSFYAVEPKAPEEEKSSKPQNPKKAAEMAGEMIGQVMKTARVIKGGQAMANAPYDHNGDRLVMNFKCK